MIPDVDKYFLLGAGVSSNIKTRLHFPAYDGAVGLDHMRRTLFSHCCIKELSRLMQTSSPDLAMATVEGEHILSDSEIEALSTSCLEARGRAYCTVDAGFHRLTMWLIEM